MTPSLTCPCQDWIGRSFSGCSRDRGRGTSCQGWSSLLTVDWFALRTTLSACTVTMLTFGLGPSTHGLVLRLVIDPDKDTITEGMTRRARSRLRSAGCRVSRCARRANVLSSVRVTSLGRSEFDCWSGFKSSKSAWSVGFLPVASWTGVCPLIVRVVFLAQQHSQTRSRGATLVKAGSEVAS